MKEYPTISDRVQSNLDITAFGKLDGSNIRAEWSQKKGFYKFGTRKRLLDESYTEGAGLGNAITIFKKQWAKILPPIFMKQRWIGKEMRVLCYFESEVLSFIIMPSPKTLGAMILTLIDVNIHKRGLLPPKEFIKIFGHLEIPKILYRGKANKTFIDSVRNSTLEGMPEEGVVCKAPNPSKKKTAKPVMFKLKSQVWYDKLRERCRDAKEFERRK